MKSLRQSIAGSPGVEFALGKFLVANHQDEEAVEAFQRELQNSPDHLLARLGIAGLLASTNPAGALPYAEQALKIAPGLPESHYLMGLVLLNLGKDDATAISELEIARRGEPNVAKVYFALGRAYASVGRKTDAARARAEFQSLSEQEQKQGN